MRKIISIIVLVAIALPAIAIAQTITSHGGSPTDLFMATHGGVCSGEDPVRRRAAALLPTAVGVGQQSHVVAFFTATTSTKDLGVPELVLRLRIEGTDFVETSPEWIEHQVRGHSTMTVMWTFSDVASGDYTVLARARVPGLRAGQSGTNLQACSLTVFVTPVA